MSEHKARLFQRVDFFMAYSEKGAVDTAHPAGCCLFPHSCRREWELVHKKHVRMLFGRYG